MRFYTAKIKIGSVGIDSVHMVDVISLLKTDGKPFHNRKQNPIGVPDPEALRYHPKNENRNLDQRGRENGSER